MSRRSVHLGVDRPDPRHYGGAVDPLAGAEADAVAWHHLARARAYDSTTLLTGAEATTWALHRWVTEAAQDPEVTDVLVTWSGHGTQVPGADGGGYEEPDGLDETWVLHDRMLLDDEVHTHLARFRPGVRVVVVADSCHSFGAFRLEQKPDIRVRLLRGARSAEVYDTHRATYDAARAAVPDELVVVADVLGLAACREDESALESGGRGHFTTAALEMAAVGTSYRELMRRAATLTPDQSPRAFWFGPSSPLLDAPAFPPGLG